MTTAPWISSPGKPCRSAQWLPHDPGGWGCHQQADVQIESEPHQVYKVFPDYVPAAESAGAVSADRKFLFPSYDDHFDPDR